MIAGLPVIVPALIRRARLEAGLTVREVAELLSVTNAAVTAHERGQNSPPGNVLVQLAALYGVRVEDMTVVNGRAAGKPIPGPSRAVRRSPRAAASSRRGDAAPSCTGGAGGGGRPAARPAETGRAAS